MPRAPRRRPRASMPRPRSSHQRSCDEAPLPERLEDHILERPLGIRAHVTDVVASAEPLELRCMCVPCSEISRRQSGCDFDLAHVAGFGIDELDLAEGTRIPVAFGGD